jgi:hypothetical protein
MTLGSAAKAGLRLIVWCRGCQHQVEPDPAQLAERYGVETRVLDWHTTKITLGTGVCLIPEHNPLLLAKQVATLDNFSGGRFIFGVGADGSGKRPRSWAATTIIAGVRPARPSLQ